MQLSTACCASRMRGCAAATWALARSILACRLSAVQCARLSSCSCALHAGFLQFLGTVQLESGRF